MKVKGFKYTGCYDELNFFDQRKCQSAKNLQEQITDLILSINKCSFKLSIMFLKGPKILEKEVFEIDFKLHEEFLKVHYVTLHPQIE